MPENSSEDLDNVSKFQSKSPTKPSPRRPIHGDSKEDERQRKDKFPDKKDSKRLYPEDELDEVPEADLDEEIEEVIKKSKAYDKIGDKNEQSLFSYFKYLLVVLLVLFPAYWFGVKPQSSDLSSSANLDQILDYMENNFENQNPLTYRIVKNALRKVVDVSHEPSAPAIITVIANKNAESKASEFSLHLAKSLVGQNYVLINESTYWHSNPDDMKLKIDEDIRSKVKNNILNAVIVDKLHNIPYKAAMIFHGYCDHELAPYKRAVFLFNVPLNVILPEDASSKQIDAAAMRQLRNIWQHATSDFIDSLITRITVNVINIR